MTVDSEKELAQIAFEAYGASTGGTTYDGKPIPPWEKVGDKVQKAWRAAAEAVCNCCVPRADDDEQ